MHAEKAVRGRRKQKKSIRLSHFPLFFFALLRLAVLLCLDPPPPPSSFCRSSRSPAGFFFHLALPTDGPTGETSTTFFFFPLANQIGLLLLFLSHPSLDSSSPTTPISSSPSLSDSLPFLPPWAPSFLSFSCCEAPFFFYFFVRSFVLRSSSSCVSSERSNVMPS